MVGYILLGLLVAFLTVILVRAILFVPKKAEKADLSPVEFDKTGAVENLAALVRCKTVSYMDHSLEEDSEFQKLFSSLPDLYPRVFDICSVQQFPGRAILLRWPGKSSEQPSVMMSHYDVVPVDEEKWDKPPFAGIMEDGVLWGRGTLDTKATMNGALFAANTLISQGFVPENDVYFAFSGGEEINGEGAPNIVQYFQDHGIEPALVVDEGGAVVENVFPGVTKPCGLIGIAEKGMINAEFYTESSGGHASAPKPNSPIPTLAKACRKLESHPFKAHIQGPAALMFDTLGRNSTFLYRLIFANLWCFGWIIDLLGRMSGGEINAMVRTTVAFTQMEGSNARNVIPTEARIVANMRLNPSDSVQSALAYLRKAVDDPKVRISALESSEPSRVSQVDCPGYNKVAAAVASTWPGCIVSPYLMVQCSDSRHYCKISDKVYRFSAMDMTAEERASIHGNNERIRFEAVYRSVEFYIRLLKQC